MTGRLGVAIVGCAHRPHAWSYARALVSSPMVRLIGIFDEDPAIGEPLAAEFETDYFADASALISAAGVRGVVVCNATVGHRGLVELAAAHGRHVLCEKPLATTLADGRAMILACRQGGVQLHSAFVTRFHPLVDWARQALQAGELGDLIAVVAGNRGRPPLPPQYPSWITTRSHSGGGALIDHSVHLTDVLRHLSGAEVSLVSAEVDSALWECGVDDMALMSLRFDSGLVASLDPSWSMAVGNPLDYDFYLRCLGTSGSLDVTDVAESLRLVSSQAGHGLRLVPFGIDVDALMIGNFVASMNAGEILLPGADGEDGLRALEVALAGYASAAQHVTVRLPWRSESSRSGSD